MNRVSPLIINSLHMKFESYWAKPVACIVPTMFNESRRWPWPLVQGLKINMVLYEALKVIGQKLKPASCPQIFSSRVWELTLTFARMTENQWGFPLIINNFEVKFENDQANTVHCIVPRMFHWKSAKVDLDLLPN